jgi:hypothetical protein
MGGSLAKTYSKGSPGHSTDLDAKLVLFALEE